MSTNRLTPFFAIVSLVAGSMAAEATILPTFDRFGSLPAATFGGTGIPNDAVAVTEITPVGSSDTITIGLAATPRFFNPALANDGAGTFTALPGFNNGGPGSTSSTLGALWNLSSFIDIDGGGVLTDYTFEFVYDFDPGAATPEGDHGVINTNNGLIAQLQNPAALSTLQGSENLTFSLFATSIPTVVEPPVFPAFDPFASGEYTFALIVSDAAGTTELGRSAIRVNVIPEPAAGALLAIATTLLGVHRRR